MIDITYTELTLGLSITCLVIFLVITASNWYPCTWPGEDRPLAPERKLYFTLSFFAFSLFCCINSDFFHYQEMVWQYDFTSGAMNHGEPIYGAIIELVGKNYLLFRIIVWGSALFIIRLTFHRFCIDSYVAQFFLFSCFFLTFSYARASLAMAIYFYGLSFLLVPSERSQLFNIICGIGLIISSYFFHHSMLIAIILTIVCIWPFNKWILISIIVSLPIIIRVFDLLFFPILSSQDFFAGDDTMSKFSRYVEAERETANWKGHLQDIISYLRFFAPLIVLSIAQYIRKEIEVPSYIDRLFKITFSLIVISLLFLSLGLDNKVFFYRILFMTYIPLTILIAFHVHEGSISRRMFIALTIYGILSQLYSFFIVTYSLIK